VIKRMQAMRRDGATLRAIGAVTGHAAKSCHDSTLRKLRFVLPGL
jgi:hypothetical protein